MNETIGFLSALRTAFDLIINLDSALLEIIFLSLRVSVTSVLFAASIGLPIAALLVSSRFRGRQTLITLVNSFMGFPPVVMGLIVYMLISRSGPLGVLGLLYTPTAMVIAQTLLILPLIIAIARQSLFTLNETIKDQCQLFGLKGGHRIGILLYEGRALLLTALLAAFGRAIAEVGAVMIVGGNIEHHTRVMTTAIALETSRGQLPLALGLGFILLMISLIVNYMMTRLQSLAWEQA